MFAFDLSKPALIGMIHLPALPGAPGARLGPDELVAHAVADAKALHAAGFSHVMVENFGDMPFTAGAIAPETVAAMAVVVHEIRRQVGVGIGVNCLRNDARSALGIAAACAARFVRVNVLTGVYAADQGVIEGRAYEWARVRRQLCPQVGIFADVHVKHATPLSQPDIGLAAEETAYRGGADAIIVSGATTGRPASLDELRRVKTAVPDKLVLVGSGATAESIRELLTVADGAIVGTALKPNGQIIAPISQGLAQSFMDAASRKVD